MEIPEYFVYCGIFIILFGAKDSPEMEKEFFEMPHLLYNKKVACASYAQAISGIMKKN